jgi:hypothetical protein
MLLQRPWPQKFNILECGQLGAQGQLADFDSNVRANLRRITNIAQNAVNVGFIEALRIFSNV